MAKGPRIDKNQLLEAGLELMEQNHKPLTKMPSKGTAKLFQLPNGETVRARTCNDHILICVADRPEESARLNIEGTDWILLVMPEAPRTPGPVNAYLLPTSEVVDEVRRTHKAWLATNPNTRGENTTWNLWFDDDGSSKASGYAKKWAQYLLSGGASTSGSPIPASVPAAPMNLGNLRDEIALARQKIASVAGVEVDAVRITIDF